MSVNTIIFSKDRAMQLDLLLRSIKDNFIELNPSEIKVYIKASNNDYRIAYLQLTKDHPEFNYIFQKNFHSDVKQLVNEITDPFCLFLVDHSVILNDFPVFESLQYLDDPSIHSVSLRLWTGISYCHPADRWCQTDNLDSVDGNILKFDWTRNDELADFGYPSGIHSHFYRTSFMKNIINRISFNNPNDIEGQMNLLSKQFPPNMICFDLPKMATICNNLTQSGYNRHNPNPKYTIENLNQLYLEGRTISTSNIYGILNNACTFEHDYEFPTWEKE